MRLENNGYPPQVKAFNSSYIRGGVNYLNIDKSEIFYRSKKKSEELGRFEDTSDEVINQRLDVFESTTIKAVNYFKNKMLKMDGYRSVNSVFKKIVNALDKHIYNKRILQWMYS